MSHFLPRIMRAALAGFAVVLVAAASAQANTDAEETVSPLLPAPEATADEPLPKLTVPAARRRRMFRGRN